MMMMMMMMMTFSKDDKIQKFFHSFDNTLSIQYHELRQIIYIGPVAYLSTMPLLNKLIY